ncbi:hypothetical protein [Enteractinococcus coprophilus]|uniref:Uncharacterized protein n=1 Tax=Enteractinococcus coprophilus TaxID=1027633 RepID=A0A543AF69_9MICC|nr:hypothetical protein [Enteractinococcus coprophilus]TQL71228.1 hypothetical protein FB556_1700 [Enteractinococcus coprophilus]
MTQPESTGIKVHGTALSEEETAALLTVINTQLVELPPPEPPVDYSTRNRVMSTWHSDPGWRTLPRGY